MDKLIKTLPAILKASGASEEVAEAACIAAWKYAVGETLNRNALPLKLQNQTLLIIVADNIWKKQLEQMRASLLFQLNSVLGQRLVRSLEFRIDPKPLAPTPEKDSTRNKYTDEQVPLELLSAAVAIEDADLRRAFLGAATSCVRRLEQE